jgi:molybdenum cofactor cytidylyltransferase
MVWALILAAGESRRMGTAKLLLPLVGSTVIESVVQTVEGAGVSGVLVVLGAEPDRVREALRGHRVEYVLNSEFRRGMLSSVQSGLRALPPSASAALVCLGDQPRLSGAAVRAVIQAGETSSRGLVVPVFGGRRGHPLLVSLRYRDEVMGLDPAVGLRQILDRHPEDILEVEAPDATPLVDMDTPEDYRKAATPEKPGKRG